ncbi:MAG TPA: folate-binding protein [Stenomitos sp.]
MKKSLSESNCTLRRQARFEGSQGLQCLSVGLGLIMQALQEYQCSVGAHIEADIPVSFGNDRAAIAAASQSVALYDRSHWGRLRISDSDRLAFLHNQSTNNIKQLQPGQGCDTVILTSTARTLDLVSAYITDTEVLVLTSPQRRQSLLSWLDRYIFFGDKVQLTDLTDATACFSLIGPDSAGLLSQIGCTELPQQQGSHTLATIDGVSVRIAAGSGLCTEGYTLIAEREAALPLWQALQQAGGIPLGEQAWEQLRVCQGRPMPDAELTEDYNPLEAGLWHTVSFNKGCYIGQETIARLNTYNGVKQQLWGLELDFQPEVGAAICVGEQKIGQLTSIVPAQSGFFGLGYIKTKAGGAGLKVGIDGGEATVVDVPFLSRSLASETTV